MRAALQTLGAVATLLLAAPATHAQDTFSAVALEGAPAPGTASTVDRVSLPASITDAGVAWAVDLDGTQSHVYDVIYVELGAGTQIVAELGDVAPGTGGQTFSDVTLPVLNDAGQVAFRAQYTDGAGSWAYGLFRWEAGVVTALALPGDPFVDAPGYVFRESLGMDMNAAGDVVFEVELDEATGGGGGSGLALHSGGALSLVFKSYETPAPVGGTFNTLYSPQINDAGDIVFIGGHAGPGVDGAGVYLHSGGVTAPLLRSGEELPGGGVPNDHLFSSQPLSLNEAGQVAVMLPIDGGPTSSAMFRLSSGGNERLAWEGQPVAGAGSIRFLYPHPAIDDAGRLAFVGELVGGSAGYGLFRADPGGATPVWLTGDPAPGVGPTGVFSVPEQRSVSAAGGGRVAFWTRVFQGTHPAGLFAATPVAPAAVKVPAVPPWLLAGLALLLAGSGGFRLAR
ncbi:MAG: DUF7453 family protein [Myxococcota bacterium]